MIRFIIFFFILINLNMVNASPNIEIANNFKKISSLKFKFIQKIDNNNSEKVNVLFYIQKKFFVLTMIFIIRF